ncbi:MAG: phosphatase PAP2 family protein [Bacteroidota bacterium]
MSPQLNFFFKAATFVGDGVFIFLILFLLLFHNLRLLLTCGVSYAISSFVVQIMKNFIFPEALRPRTYFEQNYKNIKLVLVQGVESLGSFSFPSGHTAAAFSVFLTLSLFVNNNLLKLLFILIATVVGLSRIYLSQHFFEDVYTGMLIGCFCSLLIYFYFFHYKVQLGKSKLDISLIKLMQNRTK